MLKSTATSFDLFGLSDALGALTDALASLQPITTTCAHCGSEKRLLEISTWDANQAFESCTASDALEGWRLTRASQQLSGLSLGIVL